MPPRSRKNLLVLATKCVSALTKFRSNIEGPGLFHGHASLAPSRNKNCRIIYEVPFFRFRALEDTAIQKKKTRYNVTHFCV